jgi:ATP-dependent RNA helicase DeaD
MEIAAAAIRLARANEGELALEEISMPAPEVKRERPNGRKNPYGKAREYAELKALAAAIDTGKGSKKGKRTPASPTGGDAVAQPRFSKRQEPGMVRLRMNLGNANGIRPGDVVGAIASEVGIPGRAIGEIDIRKDYTLVDVMEQHVQQVLQQSTGKYQMRGKPVMLTLAN